VDDDTEAPFVVDAAGDVEDVPAIKGDPAQIEQIIVNLAVNARDAMPEGGTLTISTERAVLDGASCRGRTQARPGTFACLSVGDTARLTGGRENPLRALSKASFSSATMVSSSADNSRSFGSTMSRRYSRMRPFLKLKR